MWCIGGEAISLIFLATYFFSYSAWDWSSFTEGIPSPKSVVITNCDSRREKKA